MSNQSTLNNYTKTMTLPNTNEISLHYTTTDKNVYALKTTIEVVDDTREPAWNLDDPNGPDHSDQLLALLASDEQDVLDAIKTYTDLRTTVPGSSLGSVFIDPDTGHITGFKLVGQHVGEPDVQINHSALEKDLQALNP